MRVLIITVKVPFIYGGAEVLAAGLEDGLRQQGHQVDTVAIPFKHYPPERILDHMLACRLIDVTQSFGTNIDLVIGLKFPAYMMAHPNKVLWLIHQHRQAYELWDHQDYGDLRQAPNGYQVREAIRRADNKFIREARRVFTLSSVVSERLRRFCAVESELLYSPPPNASAYYTCEPEDYLFFPSRLCKLKRQALVIEALAMTRYPVRVIFAGQPETTSEAQRLQSLAHRHGISGRIEWRGQVSEDVKRALYARSIAVVFPPLDEDYGYVTLEAMLSAKPVITCIDSGGPLEFVLNQRTGLVTEPTAEGLAVAMDVAWKDRDSTKSMGQQARKHYNELDISWLNVVTKLTRQE